MSNPVKKRMAKKTPVRKKVLLKRARMILPQKKSRHQKELPTRTCRIRRKMTRRSPEGTRPRTTVLPMKKLVWNEKKEETDRKLPVSFLV